MRLDRFTVKSRDELADMDVLARRHTHQELTGTHLLLSLLDQPDGLIPPLLDKAGVATGRLRNALRTALETRPKVQGGTPYLGSELKSILDGAVLTADALKDDYVSTEHLLLSMIEQRTDIGRLLAEHGVTGDSIRAALVDVRRSQRVTDPDPEGKYQALERYTTDSYRAGT